MEMICFSSNVCQCSIANSVVHVQLFFKNIQPHPRIKPSYKKSVYLVAVAVKSIGNLSKEKSLMSLPII